jgi:hypothetical protein
MFDAFVQVRHQHSRTGAFIKSKTPLRSVPSSTSVSRSWTTWGPSKRRRGGAHRGESARHGVAFYRSTLFEGHHRSLADTGVRPGHQGEAGRLAASPRRRSASVAGHSSLRVGIVARWEQVQVAYRHAATRDCQVFIDHLGRWQRSSWRCASSRRVSRFHFRPSRGARRCHRRFPRTSCAPAPKTAPPMLDNATGRPRSNVDMRGLWRRSRGDLESYRR